MSKTQARKTIDEIREKLNSDKVTHDYITLDASETPAETIITEIETPSLLSPHKVIFLKYPTENSDKEDLIECITSHLDHSSETMDLIMWENIKLRANLRFVKALKAGDAIEESPELNRRSFRTWAQEVIDEEGLNLSKDAVYLLSERVNYDPERLTKELTKLSLVGKKTITEDDVEMLCPDTLEHSIWELIDAINDNNTALAEKKLNRVLRQGNDPIYVLLMLVRNVRIILLTKLLLKQGASTYDIARKIKAPPFTISAVKEKAQRTSYDRLVTIYDKLSNIDYSGKTGLLDVDLALNILLSVI